METVTDLVSAILALDARDDRYMSRPWIHASTVTDGRLFHLSELARRIAGTTSRAHLTRIIDAGGRFSHVVRRHAALGMALSGTSYDDIVTALAATPRERVDVLWGFGMAELSPNPIKEFLQHYRDALALEDPVRRDARLVALASRASEMSWPMLNTARMASQVSSTRVRDELFAGLAEIWLSGNPSWSVELVLAITPGERRDSIIQEIIFEPGSGSGETPQLRVNLESALRLADVVSDLSLRLACLEAVQLTAQFNSEPAVEELATQARNDRDVVRDTIGTRTVPHEPVFTDAPDAEVFAVPDWALGKEEGRPLWDRRSPLPDPGTPDWWLEIVPSFDREPRILETAPAIDLNAAPSQSELRPGEFDPDLRRRLDRLDEDDVDASDITALCTIVEQCARQGRPQLQRALGILGRQLANAPDISEHVDGPLSEAIDVLERLELADEIAAVATQMPSSIELRGRLLQRAKFTMQTRDARQRAQLQEQAIREYDFARALRTALESRDDTATHVAQVIRCAWEDGAFEAAIDAALVLPGDGRERALAELALKLVHRARTGTITGDDPRAIARMIACAARAALALQDPGWRGEARLAVATALLGVDEVAAAREHVRLLRADLPPVIAAEFKSEYSSTGPRLDAKRPGSKRPAESIDRMLDRITACCIATGELLLPLAHSLSIDIQGWPLIRAAEYVAIGETAGTTPSSAAHPSSENGAPEESDPEFAEATAHENEFLARFLPQGGHSPSDILHDFEGNIDLEPTPTEIAACLGAYCTMLTRVTATDPWRVLHVLSSGTLALANTQRAHVSGSLREVPLEVCRGYAATLTRLLERLANPSIDVQRYTAGRRVADILSLLNERLESASAS